MFPYLQKNDSHWVIKYFLVNNIHVVLFQYFTGRLLLSTTEIKQGIAAVVQPMTNSPKKSIGMP